MTEPGCSSKVRGQLERRAATERLTARELRKLVREQPRQATTIEANVAPVAPQQRPRLPRPTNLKFRTCRLALAPQVSIPHGHILLDCGFGVFRSVPKTTRGFTLTTTPAYTYPVIVERVVDGDTRPRTRPPSASRSAACDSRPIPPHSADCAYTP